MIEVRDLYKEYQNKGEESKVIAVNHVSFEMKDGDFVAVIGTIRKWKNNNFESG